MQTAINVAGRTSHSPADQQFGAVHPMKDAGIHQTAFQLPGNETPQGCRRPVLCEWVLAEVVELASNAVDQGSIGLYRAPRVRSGALGRVPGNVAAARIAQRAETVAGDCEALRAVAAISG